MSPKIPHQHPIGISYPISKVEKVWSGAREPGTNPNPNPKKDQLHPMTMTFPISKVEKVTSGAREPGTNPNPNPNTKTLKNEPSTLKS